MRWRDLFCCLVLVLAGCSAPAETQPTPTTSSAISSPTETATASKAPTDSPTQNPGNLSIRVQNPQEGQYTVQIALVRGDVTGFRITDEDGATRTYDETTVGALPPGALNNVSEIRPTKALIATQVNVTGRSIAESRFPQPTGNRTVFYAVFQRGQSESLWVTGTLRCERPGPWSVGFDIPSPETVVIESSC